MRRLGEISEKVTVRLKEIQIKILNKLNKYLKTNR